MYQFVTLVLAATIVSSAATSSVTTQDAKYIEILDLFKSSGSETFTSRDQFISANREFEIKVKDKAHKDYKKRKPYAIKWGNSCDYNCKKDVGEKFGLHHRSRSLGSDHAMVYLSATELEALQTSNPNSFEYSVAVHPDLKIDPEIRPVTMATYGCIPEALRATPLTAANKSPPVPEVYKVRVVLQSMLEKDEIQEFLTFAKDLSTSSRKYAFEFEFDEDQSNAREMRGMIKTTSCDKILDIVNKFAKRSEVVWLENYSEVRTHNRWARGVCDNGTPLEQPLDQIGLSGEGEIIAVSDTGIDMMNCYFYDGNVTFDYQTTRNIQVLNPKHRKVLQYVADSDAFDDEEAHGTHVAGTVAGLADQNYGDFSLYNGMAYNAKISFYDIGITGNVNLNTPNDLNVNLFKVQYDAGARIFTNSWGTATNAYESYAQDVDTFMWEYPDAFIVFSAGNTGMKGFRTVSAPSTNKNGASVGATLNAPDSWKAYSPDSTPSAEHNPTSVAYFSSRGPTRDNRLKPDYLAPGWYTTSAKGEQGGVGVSIDYHCSVQALQGTSMAAPTSAGYAVKVRQYYREGYYPSGTKTLAHSFIPSGSLIKATMVHSGQQMANLVNNVSYAVPLGDSVYPGSIQGYGRVQMDKVLNFGSAATTDPLTMFVVGAALSTSPRYAAVSVGTPTKTYTFRTKTGAQVPVRVTMCYTDYPGSPFANNVMINVLSVRVTGTGGPFVPYLPSGFVVSNTQMIDIPAESLTANTLYTITVTGVTFGNQLNAATQPFALVVSGLGTNTYPEYVYPEVHEAPEHSALYISGGAQLYIIVLAIFCLLLIGIILYFRHITKKSKSLEVDPSKGAWTGEGQPGAMGMVLRMRQRALDKQNAAAEGHYDGY